MQCKPCVSSNVIVSIITCVSREYVVLARCWPYRLLHMLDVIGNQNCILLLQVELHKYVPSRRFDAINTDF